MSDLDLSPIRERFNRRAMVGRGFGYDPVVAAGASADDVPALIAEVERLRAALLEEQTVHAKTFDNFEAFAESSLEHTVGINAALGWAEHEYRQCIVAARCTTDSTYYAQVNGRAEAYRQLADQVAHAAGVRAPDWDQIRREVPRDGIYRDEPAEMKRLRGEVERLEREIANLTAAPLCAGCGVVLGPDVRKNRDGDGFYCDGCHTAYQGRVSAYLKEASGG